MYANDTSPPAAFLPETEILINNSTFSDAHKGARFMSLDLKDFFLATPMQELEIMKVPYKYFPDYIIKKYNLHALKDNESISIKVKKGMYGLKQATDIAYKNLINNLAPFGYHPIPHTDSYCQHALLPTKFGLCVDDCGVKFFKKRDLNHLFSALQTNYKIYTDF